jgi:hypothetical protein
MCEISPGQRKHSWVLLSREMHTKGNHYFLLAFLAEIKQRERKESKLGRYGWGWRRWQEAQVMLPGPFCTHQYPHH